MGNSLVSKKLNVQVNWNSFFLCANAVDDDLRIHGLPEDEVMERAEVVYEFYNSHVPNLVMTNTNRWTELSGLRFIPRNEARSTSASYSTETYCSNGSLPLILSPSQLLLQEHEQVAWSQRALFREQPNQNLVRLNSSLGVPTADEVVRMILFFFHWKSG
jgi:sacsin